MPLPPRHVLNRRFSRFGLYAIVTLFGLVLVLPFYYMVVTSFKSLEEITKVPISIGLPWPPSIEPYQTLLQGFNYGLFMLNSLYVATVTMIGAILFSSLAGYAFAKHNFPFKNTLFVLLLSTMLIPVSVLLVPGFLLMRDFGWLDTFWPLIVPNLAGAFNVFLARQFIQ